jgi:hypothetical protein
MVSPLPRKTAFWCLFALLLSAPLTAPGGAWAVGMANDPKGFAGIPWGSSLDAVPSLVLKESTEHIQRYDFKETPPPFGDAAVESVRLFTFDGQFARVQVRYQGQRNHDMLMKYLEAQFGPIERLPGTMMRGLNQQYTWRGTETEVTVTYAAASERGNLFVESRVLVPRFNDLLNDSGY